MRTQSVFLAVAALAASCKFAELPAIEDDAALDASPAPDASLGPAEVTTEQDAHDFGAIVIGEAAPVLRVTITNAGGEATGPLSVSLLGTDPGQFQIVPTGDATDCVNARLDGGDSCIAQVRYAPTTNVTAMARLEVSGNPGGTAVVPLTGDAVTPANVTSTTVGHDFGDLVMGQSSTLLQVVVRNEGEQTSGTLSVTLGGAHPGDFMIVPTGMANDCAGASLDLQDTCIAQVRFQPTVAATRSADLLVMGTPGGTVTVPLMGDGLSPGNLMVEMPAGGAALDFGTRELASGATSATQTIRIRNTGGAATGTLDVTLTGGGASSFTLPIESCDGATLGASAACDVQVRFNPTAVGGQPATVTVRDTVANTGASVSITGTGSARAIVTKSGQGMVMSTPTGLNCASGCSSQTFSFTQTPVSLEATAESGWVFSGWTGACASFNPSNICSLTLDEGIENVGVGFAQVFVLNVATTGSGTVTAPNAEIVCGDGNTNCDETYPVNTTVTLTAEPAAGWEVFAWNGTGSTCNASARTCMVTMNQARNVSVEFRRLFTLTVTKADGGDGSAAYGSVASTNIAGITCGADCTEVVFDGQSVTLDATAVPAAAATLTATPWTLPSGFTCATNPCTITVTQSLTARANYQIRTYDLTVTRTGSGAAMGTVTRTPPGTSCGTDCTRHPYGTSVTLEASGASFNGWTGGGCPSTGTCVVDMTTNRTVSADFTQVLALTVATTGSGTVTTPSPGILCGNGNTDCSETYPINTTVTLDAEPNAGWEVYSWTGTGTTCNPGARTCSMTMSQARTVSVVFRRRFTLTVTKADGGDGSAAYGSVASTNIAGITCGADCTEVVFDGQSVTLDATAVPAAAATLTATPWTLPSGFTCAANPCTITVTQSLTARANYQIRTYDLTVTRTGSGAAMGTVTRTPPGTSCGTDCTRHPYGTSVTLEASGASFNGWTGGGCPSTGTCVVDMTTNRSVSADFTQVLALTVSTTGSGTVTTPTPGILCGNGNSDCSETYPVNSVVTLNAEPDAGWEVYSWTGTGTTCNPGARSCSMSMSQARTVAVVFRRLFTLTVTKSDGGDGSAAYGSVASTNIAGITCGADCTEVVFDGQAVTLDATSVPTAAATLTTTPWTLPSGFTCTTNPCSITVTQSLTARANYQIRTYDLTVTRSGNGAALGTVTRNPAGTSCGTDCTRHPYGADVALDASAATGASFTGWTGGGCPATGQCTADMTTNRTVTANFTLTQYTVQITKAGFGTGTVTGTIPPATQVINCGTGSGCMASINHGTMVTLTATPTAGDIFYGWSGGGCSGTGPCVTTVTAATTVTATFDNCMRDTQTCSGSNFMQCSPTGDFVSHVIPNGANGSPSTITYDGTYVCPMGCHATLPRCGDVDASNGLDPVLDDPATSSSGLDLPSDISPRTVKSIDTSNFNASSGLTIVTLDNDAPTAVPASVITQAYGPEILVLKLRSFTVPQGTTLTVSGTRALAIVSEFDIYIAGTIDLSARTGGPGRVTTTGCVGTYTALASGGGGYSAIGGASSTAGAGGSGDFNMRIYMNPLGGGCAGGTGGLVNGGAPGGALQLAARTKVVLAPSALIDVSGGGGLATCGSAGCTSYRATGGGAGGGVLIEAPSITFESGAVIAGRGGNGAASNSGTVGVNGAAGTTTGSSNAGAAMCSGCGVGGVGGTETTLAGSAGMGTAPAIAGGGGGVGRCVTRTRTGAVMIPSGTMKIAHQAFALPAAD